MISAGPTGINVALGGTVQIGILDPGKFPLTVSASGGLLPGALGAVSNLVNGILQPNAQGIATLQLNSVAGENLNALVGASGSTLRICQQGSSTNCTTATLMSLPAGLAITSSLASVTLQPGQSEPLTVSALSLLGGAGPFTAVSSNANVIVSPTGNGMFSISAALNAGIPTTASVTVTDAHGHSISIPVAVF